MYAFYVHSNALGVRWNCASSFYWHGHWSNAYPCQKEFPVELHISAAGKKVVGRSGRVSYSIRLLRMKITVKQNHSVTRVTKNPAQRTFLPLKVNLYPMAQRSWGSQADLIWFVFRLSLHHQGIGPPSFPKARGGKWLAGWSLDSFTYATLLGKAFFFFLFASAALRLHQNFEGKQKSLRMKLCEKSNLKHLDEENMGSWRRWSHGRRAEDAYREEMKPKRSDEEDSRGLPVRGCAPPGQVVIWTGCGTGDNRLLHCRYVSRVGFEKWSVLTGQHRPLVTSKLCPSILEPHLWEQKPKWQYSGYSGYLAHSDESQIAEQSRFKTQDITGIILPALGKKKKIVFFFSLYFLTFLTFISAWDCYWHTDKIGSDMMGFIKAWKFISTQWKFNQKTLKSFF